jgi:hypothetical protein
VRILLVLLAGINAKDAWGFVVQAFS